MSRLIFVISYILATLLCTCRASPAGERRIVQNAAPEQESRVCAAASSAITSARDFQAKIRADPRVCSIHDGFFHLVSRDTNDDYSCSETKPCSNGACCAKTGFCNYGPEACGTNGQSPNDKCWSNCDAHAACGQYSVSGDTTCPLNVCCSQYGFCGTGTDFCGDGCQSDCNQPGSGGSNGDVQQRIIGYYEGWNQNEKCIGMGLQDIPINGITHLHLAFASLSSDFDVIPMDGLSTQLFSDITALKSQNAGLKVLASIGGWSFSDNGTNTQPIFPDMVSSADKRSTAITKMMSFMRQFAFDGIDIDWEYPGAGDRGGGPDDGENFTQFLKELRAAIDGSGTKYLVSFTAPTSYWYLQHFDIKGSASYADWVNVMSYDLHGVWDANDPIGNHVLAHTNLSEINEALNLFWRNDVPPDKLNLGLGFYGRTFQLADPGCSTPGCLFKGGASPGPCTKNSGTLSYSEIQDVIKQYSLTPIHDETNAVNYITWNNDQWASFDDQTTFQQKIKFANNLGLGGLLIWALDLDTQDLQALQGVLYPKTISSLQSQADIVDNWSDVNGGDCRGTTCGTTGCRPGEIELTTFQCDGEGSESTVCCPLSSAPDPKSCSWQGTAPFCNGQCLVGQVALLSSLWGDGDYCSDGRKFYCCDVQEEAKKIDCRWGDCGSSCNDDEDQLTWRYDDCWDGSEPFCCKKGEDWQNCAWHGEPGSCYDDHCDTGHQVELANSYEGEGEDCGWQDRTRVFCCDPPADQSPFLPVELDYLFPDPPPEDIAKAEYKLKTDPTFGGAVSVPFANEPNEAAFGFIVLTSPETIQISLDKRDGSHWEVFDCFDAVSESEHTVRMVCTDESLDSNCNMIHLGKGVPGTILEMPEGCGPGKYAVAVGLEPSRNQKLPSHLEARNIARESTIYDLRFDYNFARVPRDMGDTQMRIDFANEDGYWDKVVDKAAGSKRKRSLDEFKGNHRRWLEEAWRDDKHLSELSAEELHKRWFGSDIIDWLKGLINGVTGGPAVHHSYTDDFTAILLRESWSCSSGITTASAQLDVEANVHVGINTNFGLTIIATLGSPIDLSNSYLYFRNDGEVTAKFTLDALASVNFDTGDMTLLSADKFGAAFAVPGIVTIGPNFKLVAQVEGGITVSAHLESQVNIAKWNVQQTFPDANSDWDPKATEDIDPSGTQDMTPSNEPAFDASVAANGYLTAHLKPEIVFGIEFNQNFIPVDPASVNLIADGFVTAYADASASISGGASFCYGVDAGAQLYATVSVPQAFKWVLPQSRFQIGPQLSFEIIPQTCPVGNSARDLIDNGTSYLDGPWQEPPVRRSANTISREIQAIEPRGQVYGPIIHLPSNILKCPGQSDQNTNATDSKICDFCADLSQPENGDGNNKRRDDGGSCPLPEAGDPDEPTCPPPSSGSSKRSILGTISNLWKRAVLVKRDRKKISWSHTITSFLNPYPLDCGAYPACSEAEGVAGVPKYYDFNNPSSGLACDGIVQKQTAAAISPLTGKRNYQTDHIYEVQTARDFMDFVRGNTNNNGYSMPKGYTAASDSWLSPECMGLRGGITDNDDWLWKDITLCFGNSGTDRQARLALVNGAVNGHKGTFFGLNNPAADVPYSNNQPDQSLAHQRIFDTGGVFTYMNDPAIWQAYKDTSTCIESALWSFDQSYAWGSSTGELGRPADGTFNGQTFHYGLRSLYTGWIDAELKKVEQNARNWQSAAKTAYTNAFPTANNAIAKSFVDTIMGGTGKLTANGMSFPASPASKQTSKYGVWGSSSLPPPF